MNRGDGHEGPGETGTGSELPGDWEGTGRHPYLPDGNVGTCESEHGTILYDRDHPDRYIIGTTIELGESN